MNPVAKKILSGLAVPTALVGAAHVASMLTTDLVLQNVELSYPSPKVGPGLDGYAIAFVTDVHSLPAQKLRALVGDINRRGVDLLLIGGDFPRKDAMWRALEILAQARAADGIYGVAGNHDKASRYCGAMKRLGMHPLENQGVRLRENLYLGGTEDLRRGWPDVEKAMEGALPGDFIVLLTHNPDVAMLQDGMADLALSGHTHGGQINFFGLWSPPMAILRRSSQFGNKLRTGWVRTPGGTDLYVSNGVGTHKRVPRVFARPQMVYLTLRQG